MDASLLLVVASTLSGAGLAAVVLLIRHSRLAADHARIGAELRAAEQALAHERSALATADARLREAFASLSKDALKDNRADFTEHAGQLLAPLRDTLRKVEAQLGDVDKAREGSFRAVTSQLQSLSRTQDLLHAATSDLTRSLRSPNVRGKWGEVQLRRIVELAGMLEQCDFAEKVITGAPGARQIPDLVVRLPGQGTVIIDAKVPIDAYLASTNARTDAERDTLLATHARQVRDHIRALGAKEYWKQFQPAPEFVVMFLPLEPLLASAFEHDGALLDLAASQRVIPATPMTLLALLKAVAFGWQQQALAQNAEDIQQLGRDSLYERLATLVDHLQGVGRNIEQAADSYNRFVGSLEQKVLPAARRFKELGVSSAKAIEPSEPLDVHVRRVTRDELLAQADDDVPARPFQAGGLSRLK